MLRKVEKAINMKISDAEKRRVGHKILKHPN